MLTFLVETKQEYTTQLINILTPLVYEGLQSVYNEILTISSNESTLKNFQYSLQKIPKWNNDIIHKETQRIMNNSKSFSWLEDLIRATLKANIVVLTYNPTVRNQVKVDPLLYQNIKIDDFIHKIYIECAREFWNNPYLFYHSYSPIELKRNQRDCINVIKDCTKEAIRKLLPVKHILKIYLNEELEADDDIEVSIPEKYKNQLNKLVNMDLHQNNNVFNSYNNNDSHKSDSNRLDNHNKLDSHKLDSHKLDSHKLDSHNIPNPNKYLNEKNNDSITSDNIQSSDSISSNGTIGSKILDIINNKNIKLTDNEDKLDNKISNALNKLDHSETSSVYQQPSYNSNKFQEVFSNGKNKEIIGSEQQNGKTKFFKKYLNV